MKHVFDSIDAVIADLRKGKMVIVVDGHIPILPPRTAVIIAHAVSADGRSVLGASYDHRVLNGSHIVMALRKLSKPTDRE